jgi:phosphopantothenoylcysteine synthetase/decarboxylase
VTDAHRSRVLYIIVCGAGPACDVTRLVDLAQQRRWDIQVIATPPALDFIDAASLETQTGRLVRSQYRKPGQPRSPKADAIIIAPASYNTINKWANGISDTYALGILAEAPGLGIPVVVLPFVNIALATRRAFRRSIDELQTEGVHVLLEPHGYQPHAPGTGGQHIDTFPWQLALDQADRMHARSAE